MSKYLIIYTHPNREGHNGYLLSRLEETMRNNQLDYELFDLYQLEYNPVLKDDELYTAGRKNISSENKEYQAKIQAADRLIFIYPTWWQGPPAILKGFIDRVFVSGFGFKYRRGLPQRLLKGKKAAVFTTTNGPAAFFRFVARQTSLKLVTRYVLLFCGIKSLGYFLTKANNLEKNRAKLDKIVPRMLAYLK